MKCNHDEVKTNTAARSDDAVEKRLRVQALRKKVGEPRSVREKRILKSADRDIQVAMELEVKDPAAAVRRLRRSWRSLKAIRVRRRRHRNAGLVGTAITKRVQESTAKSGAADPQPEQKEHPDTKALWSFSVLPQTSSDNQEKWPSAFLKACIFLVVIFCLLLVVEVCTGMSKTPAMRILVILVIAVGWLTIKILNRLRRQESESPSPPSTPTGTDTTGIECRLESEESQQGQPCESRPEGVIARTKRKGKRREKRRKRRLKDQGDDTGPTQCSIQ